VQNTEELWLLFQDSKTWSSRPSQLLGVEDPYAAYCIDQAVAYWGRHLESEMDKAERNTKNEDAATRARQAVLDRYMPRPENQKHTGNFSDPAAMFG